MQGELKCDFFKHETCICQVKKIFGTEVKAEANVPQGGQLGSLSQFWGTEKAINARILNGLNATVNEINKIEDLGDRKISNAPWVYMFYFLNLI